MRGNADCLGLPSSLRRLFVPEKAPMFSKERVTLFLSELLRDS